MAKIKDQIIIEEEKRQKEFIEEQEARYLAILNENNESTK